LIEIGKKSAIPWFANNLPQTLSQFGKKSMGLMAIQVP